LNFYIKSAHFHGKNDDMPELNATFQDSKVLRKMFPR